MATNLRQITEASFNEVNAKLDELRGAIQSNDFQKVQKAETVLKEAEKSYAKDKRVEVFATLKGNPNPVRAAIEQYSYQIISHKIERDDNGVPISVEMVEKNRQIDLVQFFQSCNKPLDFKYKAEKLNQLLAVRVATDIEVNADRLKEIRDSKTMSDIAQKVEMGATPTSTTQLVKQLQMVVDDILFEDDGNGKNKLKVLSRDAKYVVAVYTRKGKDKLTVKVSKTSQLIGIITDVMYRLVTDGAYDVEGIATGDKAKAIKAKADTKKAEKKAEPKKVSKPKAEKVSKDKAAK